MLHKKVVGKYTRSSTFIPKSFYICTNFRIIIPTGSASKLFD